MYSEETELCLALERAGFVNTFVPDAVITHIGGAASLDRFAEQQVVAAKSEVAYLRRHASAGLRAYHRALSAAAYGGRAALFAIAARLHPNREATYRRRGDAASQLWRYYAFDYS